MFHRSIRYTRFYITTYSCEMNKLDEICEFSTKKMRKNDKIDWAGEIYVSKYSQQHRR